MFGVSDVDQLSKRIHKARIEANLSQAALGKGIGLSDKSISAYEQGRATPSISKLKKIASQTKKPLQYFTQEQTVEIDINGKLESIEAELAELKKLLKKQK